jgi:hypothetical protein
VPTKIRLREVVDEDLPRFFEHQSDTEASRMAVFPIRDHDSFTAHAASIRVLEKCGFVLCGSRVEAEVEELVFGLK